MSHGPSTQPLHACRSSRKRLLTPLLALCVSTGAWGLEIGPAELESSWGQPLHLMVPITLSARDREGPLDAQLWLPEHPEIEPMATLTARRRGADILLELRTDSALRASALALRVDVWTDRERVSRAFNLPLGPVPRPPTPAAPVDAQPTEQTSGDRPSASRPSQAPAGAGLTSLERLRARQAAAAQPAEPTPHTSPAPSDDAPQQSPSTEPDTTSTPAQVSRWRGWQIAGVFIALLGLAWLLFQRLRGRTVHVPPPGPEQVARTVILPSQPRLAEATVILPEAPAHTPTTPADGPHSASGHAPPERDTPPAPHDWSLDTLQVEDEAHLHEVYGEHEEAARILRASIEQGETRGAYLLRLLHNYALSGQRDAFVELATALYRDRKDDQSIDWPVVRDMGAKLAPELPIFRKDRLDFDLDAIH